MGPPWNVDGPYEGLVTSRMMPAHGLEQGHQAPRSCMYHGPGLHQWVMGLVFGPSPACPSHTWDRLFTAPCGTVLNRFVPPLVALPVPTLTLTLTLTLVTYTYGLVLYVCSVQWLLRFGPCLLFCVAAALLYARVKQACPACNRPIAPTTSSGHGTRSGFILHAASEREPRACPSHTRLVHPLPLTPYCCNAV